MLNLPVNLFIGTKLSSKNQPAANGLYLVYLWVTRKENQVNKMNIYYFYKHSSCGFDYPMLQQMGWQKEAYQSKSEMPNFICCYC